MNMEEIKTDHEASGGRFFFSVGTFYGQNEKHFKVIAPPVQSLDPSETIMFRCMKPVFRQQEVYSYNLFTKEIN